MFAITITQKKKVLAPSVSTTNFPLSSVFADDLEVSFLFVEDAVVYSISTR
jgi:hypothetical protein